MQKAIKTLKQTKPARAGQAFAQRTWYYLSESGLVKLKSRLQETRERRAEHLERLRALRQEQSDGLSVEDSSYLQTINTLGFLEAEMKRLEGILARAKVIASRQRRRVRLGSRVQLEGKNECHEYTIVSSIEADPFEGKISDKSPLGQQLLGKQLEDTVTIATPNSKPRTLRLVGLH